LPAADDLKPDPHLVRSGAEREAVTNVIGSEI
jgi:hypothetical protein